MAFGPTIVAMTDKENNVMAAATAVISDGVALRAMTVDDLPAAHAMSVEMRWPHRALDWEQALRQGEGLVRGDLERRQARQRRAADRGPGEELVGLWLRARFTLPWRGRVNGVRRAVIAKPLPLASPWDCRAAAAGPARTP